MPGAKVPDSAGRLPTPTPPTKLTSRTRETSKRETRDALVDAGIALFAQKGLDGPSLDEICERAGFTRGAFYVHFESRDEFLEAVMAKVGESLVEEALGPEPGEPGLLRIVQRFVEGVARGDHPLVREGGLRPHQLLDACVRSPLVRSRYLALATESLARLGGRVESGQDARALRHDVDAAQIATILLAAAIGAQTMIELRVPFDLPAATGTLLALLAPATAEPR